MTGSDETVTRVRSRATSDRPVLTPTRRGRVLLLWMLGQVVGMAGTRLINVAVPWFVLVTTREPALAGIAAFAQMGPLVLAKTLAGPMIDRVGAVRVAVTADLASCLAVGIVPLLHHLGWLSWPLLVAIAAIEGTLRGPGDSAKYALCPRLADGLAMPMERVTGLAGTVDRIGSAVGAAFGGLVIAMVGAPLALILSCGTFVGAALLIGLGVGPALARLSPAVPDAPGATEQASYGRRLREGFDYWRTDAVLVSITALVALTNLIDQAYLAVLVPEWALRDGHGAETVGLIFGAYTAAAVAGSAIATAVADRLPRLGTCVVAFLLTGPPRYLALALGAPRPVLLPLVCLAGLASGFLNPVIGAVVFGRIPPALVGRVSSLQTSLCWLLIPFGGVVGGLLVSGLGGPRALAVCGATYVVLALMPLVVPGWRSIGARPAPAG